MTAPDRFVVVSLTENSNRITNALSLTFQDEMEADAVARALLALGRVFFVNTSGDNGKPTIEEYGLGDDVDIGGPT